MDVSVNAPNREYLHFNLVKASATGGINKEITMERQDDETFLYIEGKVGIRVGTKKPKTWVRSMEVWDDTYRSLINHGYFLNKTRKMEKKTITKKGLQGDDGKTYQPIKNTVVATIVDRLMGFARKTFTENYQTTIDDIDPEMLRLGTEILNKLATEYENMTVKQFNEELIRYFQAIPRRMDNVLKKLAKSKEDFKEILADEQEIFDIMKSQLKDEEMKSEEKTILDCYGIEWEEVTEKERDDIIKMLRGDATLVNAWKIKNKKTEKAFNDYCEKENLTEKHGISHLFHGSRAENFWSIITNGLTINPVGVVITGKAFGNGTYFAPNAIKSLGYTSFQGSKWANGNMSTGFMGIYKVATGKCYDGRQGVNCSLNWNVLQKIAPGCHCTWAKARWSGFVMDEVIVYQDCQSTIEYLIEVKK